MPDDILKTPQQNNCKHKLVESKYEFVNKEDGDKEKYIVIFCEKCGLIIKKPISHEISMW